MMRRNIVRLEGTVDSILDFSVIEAGKTMGEKKRLSIKGMVGEVVSAELPKLRSKKVSLEAEVPRGLFVQGDRRWLTRVLTNLVDNAVKFTDSGLITVSARREKGYILVSVKDTGRGIRKGDLPKIFHKFTKLETHVPGSGIGLWASKKVIEEHGGRIWVESKRGKGTTVFFTLPEWKKK